MPDSSWGQVYKELGVNPVINAIGSVTMLGGSTLATEVQDAMAQASAYVPLMELEEKAGAVIAEMTGVPASYITSGAGSALTLAAAAVMAGDDDAMIQQLPDTTNMKNEILIQRRQRYWYDRCLEASGAKLVEFGTENRTSREDLQEAIGPSTAAIHYHAVEQTPDPKTLPLPDIIDIAHSNDIPVTVDAAGQIYPLDLFGKYIRMGADFQCIAAKYMGSSQSTGLALGTKDMIRKISKQSFVHYEGRRVRGIGRPHKVDRQEMVGVVAAVKRWMTMNHEERLANIEYRCQSLIRMLADVSGINVKLVDNIIGHHPFGVELRVDAHTTGIPIAELVEMLKRGNPSIWTRVHPDKDCITIHMFGLNDGEEIIVGKRIATLLGK